MSRPIKQSLDYFPMDVNMDDKIELIEAKYGLVGFAVIVKLWQKIYASEGYYYEWTEEKQLIFCKRNGIEFDTLQVLIADCFKWSLFDKSIFDKYKILTSKGIQKRYIEASKRKQNLEIITEYWLLVTETPVNVTFIPLNDDIGTQSILKYTKVDKSKGDKIEKIIIDEEDEIFKTAVPQAKENILKLVNQINQEMPKLFSFKKPLLFNELMKLIRDYGLKRTTDMLYRLQNYSKAGKTTDTVYYTVRDWLNRENVR